MIFRSHMSLVRRCLCMVPLLHSWSASGEGRWNSATIARPFFKAVYEQHDTKSIRSF